jgi:tripartite-type tricarboxylate transporter receptor subunit TctC
MIAEKLGAEYRQPIVVENRAGGNTVIGATAVAQSKPDGYMLYLTTNQHVALPALIGKLPFDPVRDFVPITTMSASELFVVVKPDTPVNTLADFLKWAKSEPKGLSYSSGGVGASGHLGCSAIADRAGLNLVHVPYKGVTDAMAAVLGGTVHFTCAAGSNAIPMVNNKQLKALFTTGARRHRALPAIPTLRELEPGGLVFGGWSALVAPRGTPQPVLEKLNGSVTAMMRTPDYERFTDRIGSTPAPRSLAEAAEYFVSEEKLQREIIRKAGIQPE